MGRSIGACCHGMLVAIFSATHARTHPTTVVYIENPAVFSLDGQRRELHVTGRTPTTCSDQSRVVRDWTVGNGKHNRHVRTHTLTCASGMAEAHDETSYHATVCHPMIGHMGNKPARWAVERWVEHYLNHGFDHVFLYVYDELAAAADVANTTWFVAPWLEHMNMHQGGQEAAVQHCLHWNKQSNNTWTLFADIDEYVVATQMHTRRGTDLVRMATHSVGNTRHLAGVDFGEYRITDFMHRLDGTNDDQMVARIRFNPNATRRGEQSGSRAGGKTS